MLEKLRQQSFTELVSIATTDELIWMNGFLSGTLAWRKNGNGENVSAVSLEAPAHVPVKITIAYGTETGNAKGLAGKLSALAKKQGVIAKTVSLDQYRTGNLSKEQLLFVVISTQGDGEPPLAGRPFYDYLHTTTEKLQQLRFGVIALGDSSYPLFCQTGKDIDEKLYQLGGSRIQPVQLCDTDYEDTAFNWFRQALTNLQNSAVVGKVLHEAVPTAVGTHKKYYQGVIQRNVNLNDAGSEKQTHHIEIATENLSYEPGDSLGIVPKNPLEVVEAILGIVGIQPETDVVYRNETSPVSELLQHKLNITHLPVRLVKRYATIVGREIPEVAIGLNDLLVIYPLKDVSQFNEVLQILDPIAPRLYSISSSPAGHEGEVHITVKRDEFYLENETRFGLCSDYLTTLPEGTEIRFYIHPNKQFRLPASNTDIIMIGAGTGIAPFRSFVSERAAQGAEGRNWLFFGDQRFSTDFLYQTEWQGHQQSGVLSRINTAFSRDQKEKVYVQHRLASAGETVFDWLEGGASVYVCGAREPMSVDVERTLLEIIAEHGGKSIDEAQAYLHVLEESDRYLKDVY